MFWLNCISISRYLYSLESFVPENMFNVSGGRLEKRRDDGQLQGNGDVVVGGSSAHGQGDSVEEKPDTIYHGLDPSSELGAHEDLDSHDESHEYNGHSASDTYSHQDEHHNDDHGSDHHDDNWNQSHDDHPQQEDHRDHNDYNGNWDNEHHENNGDWDQQGHEDHDHDHHDHDKGDHDHDHWPPEGWQPPPPEHRPSHRAKQCRRKSRSSSAPESTMYLPISPF